MWCSCAVVQLMAGTAFCRGGLANAKDKIRCAAELAPILLLMVCIFLFSLTEGFLKNPWVAILTISAAFSHLVLKT